MAKQSRADIRVLLVAREGPACRAYQVALEKLAVPHSTVHDFHEAQELLHDEPHNGVLVDLATAIRGSQACKVLAHEMLDLFPVVRMKWDAQQDRIHTLFYGQTENTADGLAEFIDQQCLPFPARTIRRIERKLLHANLLLSHSPEFPPEDLEKTNSLDLSPTGCFIYSVRDWEPDEDVWIRCPDLSDDTPIRATVAWSLPWGLPGRLPGIGVQFSEVTPAQREELDRYLMRGFEAAANHSQQEIAGELSH